MWKSLRTFPGQWTVISMHAGASPQGACMVYVTVSGPCLRCRMGVTRFGRRVHVLAERVPADDETFPYPGVAGTKK